MNLAVGSAAFAVHEAARLGRDDARACSSAWALIPRRNSPKP